jgi:hypothetical protein
MIKAKDVKKASHDVHQLQRSAKRVLIQCFVAWIACLIIFAVVVVHNI